MKGATCLDMVGDSSLLFQVEDNMTGGNRILQNNVIKDIDDKIEYIKCLWKANFHLLVRPLHYLLNL